MLKQHKVIILKNKSFFYRIPWNK